MSIDTDIQYLDSTGNPVTGCAGCELAKRGAKSSLCYAKPYHENRLARAHPDLYDASFFNVRAVPGRMKTMASYRDLRGVPRIERLNAKGKILRRGKPWIDPKCPRLNGISFLGDALSNGISYQYLVDEIFFHCKSKKGSRHMWIWLTKQTDRLVDFDLWLEIKGIEWPDNLMMVVSVTSPKTQIRLGHLRHTSAKLKGISVEPILHGPIDLFDQLGSVWVDQVYIGGCSDQVGKAAETNFQHIDHLHAQCQVAGVPAFIKQLGSRVVMPTLHGEKVPVNLNNDHGGDWNEWPEDIGRSRQLAVDKFIEAVENAQAKAVAE